MLIPRFACTSPSALRWQRSSPRRYPLLERITDAAPWISRWCVAGSLFVLAGALAGAWIASQVHSRLLAMVFAAMAFLIALKLLLPNADRAMTQDVPRHPSVLLVPAGIGTISSMMGIGGGTLSVAALTLFNQPIHRAVGTAALFGLAISVPGALGFVVAGLGDPRLPIGSIGFVSLPGLLLIAPMTALTAPVGAAIAHRLSQRTLSLLFGVFLLAMSIRMGWNAYSA